MRLLASCSQFQPSKSSNLSFCRLIRSRAYPLSHYNSSLICFRRCFPLPVLVQSGPRNPVVGSRPPCPICATPSEYSLLEVKGNACGPLPATAPSPPFPLAASTALLI